MLRTVVILKKAVETFGNSGFVGKNHQQDFAQKTWKSNIFAKICKRFNTSLNFDKASKNSSTGYTILSAMTRCFQSSYLMHIKQVMLQGHEEAQMFQLQRQTAAKLSGTCLLDAIFSSVL